MPKLVWEEFVGEHTIRNLTTKRREFPTAEELRNFENNLVRGPNFFQVVKFER